MVSPCAFGPSALPQFEPCAVRALSARLGAPP